MSNTKGWEREALRLYERYEIEIVEACGLCPWAERARLDGHVEPRVIVEEPEAALEPSLAAMKEIEQSPQVEVALLIYPLFDLDRLAFEAFVTRVREADAARHPIGEIPFVMAAFHPDAPADLATPERLIPFLRRTPDPTIQLLRSSTLDRVRGRAPQGTQFVDVASFDFSTPGDVITPLRERIARANLDTVQKLGVPELDRRLRDIRRDRDEAYRALVARD